MTVSELQLVDKKLSTEVLHRSEGDLLTQDMLSRHVTEALAENERDYQRYLEFVVGTENEAAELRTLVSNVQQRLLGLHTELNNSVGETTTEIRRDLEVVNVGIQKYLRVLNDATLDSDRITWDNGEIQLGAWTFLSQARMWDLEILKKVNNLSAGINTAIKDAVEESFKNYDTTESIITKVIDQLGETSVVRKLDAALNKQIKDVSTLNQGLLIEANARSEQLGTLENALTELITNSTSTLEHDVDEKYTELLDNNSRLLSVVNEKTALLAETVEQTKITIDEIKQTSNIETLSKIESLTIPLQANGSWYAGDRSNRASSITYQQAFTDMDTSFSQKLEVISASIGEVSGAVSELIQVNVKDLGDKITVTAESIEQVSTTVGNLTTTVQEQARSIDGIYGEYTVKIDNNGLISGFGLVNDGKTSSFGVDADYFYVGKGEDTTKPFLVINSDQTINGVEYKKGVWIDVATIAYASIGTAHISDAAIDNAKIKDASITDAKIDNMSISKLTSPGSEPFSGRVPANEVTVTGVNINNVSALFDEKYLKGSAVCTFGNGEVTDDETNYIQIDLKEQRVIKQFILWFLTDDHREHKYKIKTSKDGIKWNYIAGGVATWIRSNKTKAVENESLTDISMTLPSATPTKVIASFGMDCRYIRIYGNGNDVDGTNALYELELHSEYVDTVIDGSNIIAKSIRADHLNVNKLSAITADMGTIQVGEANIQNAAITGAKIKDLEVSTLKIGNRAVTSSLYMVQDVNWSEEYAIGTGFHARERTFTLYGLENSTPDSMAIFFLQFTNGRIINAITNGLWDARAEIYFDDVLIKSVFGGRYTASYTGPDPAEGGSNIITYTTTSAHFQSLELVPINIPASLIKPSVTVRVRFSVTNPYGTGRIRLGLDKFVFYMVEFKK